MVQKRSLSYKNGETSLLFYKKVTGYKPVVFVILHSVWAQYYKEK